MERVHSLGSMNMLSQFQLINADGGAGGAVRGSLKH